MMSNLNFPDAAEQDIRGALQQTSKKRLPWAASAWAER